MLLPFCQTYGPVGSPVRWIMCACQIAHFSIVCLGPNPDDMGPDLSSAKMGSRYTDPDLGA